MEMTRTMIELMIRSRIADKEAETAKANHELSRGGWLSDHAQTICEYNCDIEILINQWKEALQ
jgi:hypothetical protein